MNKKKPQKTRKISGFFLTYLRVSWSFPDHLQDLIVGWWTKDLDGFPLSYGGLFQVLRGDMDFVSFIYKLLFIGFPSRLTLMRLSGMLFNVRRCNFCVAGFFFFFFFFSFPFHLLGVPCFFFSSE